MSTLTWQQVTLVSVIFLALLVSAKLVPEAAPSVASIAFAAVGATFVNRSKTPDTSKGQGKENDSK